MSQAAEREADNWKRLKEAAESEAVKLAQLLEEAKRKAVASHQETIGVRGRGRFKRVALHHEHACMRGYACMDELHRIRSTVVT